MVAEKPSSPPITRASDLVGREMVGYTIESVARIEGPDSLEVRCGARRSDGTLFFVEASYTRESGFDPDADPEVAEIFARLARETLLALTRRSKSRGSKSLAAS